MEQNMKYTPEPWNIAEEAFDNYGYPESVIRGIDGRAAIAVTLDFGDNNPEMREANARRIVACINYCAGKKTELLEAAAEYDSAEDDAEWEPPHPIFMMAEENDTLTQQRNELLAEIRKHADWLDGQINMNQAGFDSPPEPATQFDADLASAVGHLYSLIAKVESK
jgi:hypothetical protein